MPTCPRWGTPSSSHILYSGPPKDSYANCSSSSADPGTLPIYSYTHTPHIILYSLILYTLYILYTIYNASSADPGTAIYSYTYTYPHTLIPSSIPIIIPLIPSYTHITTYTHTHTHIHTHTYTHTQACLLAAAQSDERNK
jgi:hypothetical protein